MKIEHAAHTNIRDYTRTIIARSLASNSTEAAEIAAQRWGSDSRAVRLVKAAVGAATTSGNLVGDERVAASEFFRHVDQGSIVGQLNLRRVPFHTRMLVADGGEDAAWVAEGSAVPVSVPSFSDLNLKPLHVAALTVQTRELLESADPAAEAAITDVLTYAIRREIDGAFITPSNAGSAGVSPASITNGLTAITSSGTDAEAVRTDIMAVTGAYTGEWSRAAVLMHPRTAISLGLMQAPLGGAAMAMAGRSSIFGIQWLISGGVPNDIVVMIDMGDVAVGLGEGQVKSSTQGALQMADDPTMDAGDGTATNVVSLWQTNAVALMLRREANWTVTRDSVVMLDGVEWGQPAASGA